jgi:carboxylesterase
MTNISMTSTLLNCATDRSSSAHAVLLIHGLCGSPQELMPLTRRLEAAGFAVRAPLAPAGYGMQMRGGETIAPYEEWVDFFRAQLEELIARHPHVSVGGLCIGANLALELAARYGERVDSLILISTTLFYDGWNVPRTRVLLPLAYYSPLRRWLRYREIHPYGVKNVRLREWIAGQMQATGTSDAGAGSLPMDAIYQAQRLIRSVKRKLPRVVAPALVMHARDDDVTSLRSADLVCTGTASREVLRRVFEDSYHLLTLDNDRNCVTQAAVDFLNRPRRSASMATLSSFQQRAPVVTRQF